MSARWCWSRSWAGQPTAGRQSTCTGSSATWPWCAFLLAASPPSSFASLHGALSQVRRTISTRALSGSAVRLSSRAAVRRADLHPCSGCIVSTAALSLSGPASPVTSAHVKQPALSSKCSAWLTAVSGKQLALTKTRCVQDVITQLSFGVELNVQDPENATGPFTEITKNLYADCEATFHGANATSWFIYCGMYPEFCAPLLLLWPGMRVPCADMQHRCLAWPFQRGVPMRPAGSCAPCTLSSVRPGLAGAQWPSAHMGLQQAALFAGSRSVRHCDHNAGSLLPGRGAA